MIPVLVIVLLLPLVTAQSCKGRCDDPYDPNEVCQCNSSCSSHHDCCPDYIHQCSNSCQGRCDDPFDPSFPCQCNSGCSSHQDCCEDYTNQCPTNGLSDQDLLYLSSMLLSQDTDSAQSDFLISPQCTTSPGSPTDCSPAPLFSCVSQSLLEKPVYVKLRRLYDNYIQNPGIAEDHTEEEQEEERDFLEEVMDSKVMTTTYNFLASRGAFLGSWVEWTRYCYDSWFGQYSRSHSGHPGSSGFEHVFLGEVKGDQVSGLHNWFRLYMLEMEGNMEYLGYWEHVTWDGGQGLSFTYTWDGHQKDFGTAFFGTSPTLELALYTTCLLTRPDSKCHVNLGGQDVFIQTWRFTVGSQVFVGSSYPDWHL